MKKTTIISVANEKWGVGKTTTALNVGAALASKGYKVLLIDLDQQANLTDYLGYENDNGHTISDVIFAVASGHKYEYVNSIRFNADESLYYIPASKMLASTTAVLSSISDSQEVMKKILSSSFFNERFDYIIIDCRTALDLLVTNALVASDKLLIPAQAEKFSIDGVNGVMSSFYRIKRTLNPNVELGGILINMYDKRTNMAKAVEDSLRYAYKEKVFKTVIPRLVEATNSTCEQRSLINTKNSRLGELYLSVAEEILKWA